MSSAARIVANQENAKLSTGPRTESGKELASRNSFRHGLASSQLIIPGEQQSAFDAMAQELVAQHSPVGAIEEMLLQQVAQFFWFTQRAIRLQAEQFQALTDPTALPSSLAVLLRYQNTNERAFQKALATLSKTQKERKEREFKARSGFVSHNGFPPGQSPWEEMVSIPGFRLPAEPGYEDQCVKLGWNRRQPVSGAGFRL